MTPEETRPHPQVTETEVMWRQRIQWISSGQTMKRDATQSTRCSESSGDKRYDRWQMHSLKRDCLSPAVHAHAVFYFCFLTPHTTQVRLFSWQCGDASSHDAANHHPAQQIHNFMRVIRAKEKNQKEKHFGVTSHKGSHLDLGSCRIL